MRAGPVGADFVGGFEGSDEMVSIGARRVAYAKIVNNKAEDDVSGVVAPESRHEGNRTIAVGSQKGNELIVGEAAGLGKAIHSAANFNVYVSVVKERTQVTHR